jgi:deoxycytidylate deaminase
MGIDKYYNKPNLNMGNDDNDGNNVNNKLSNKRNNYYVKIAINEAKKSAIENKHGSIVVDRNGNIISYGHNKHKYYYICDIFHKHRKGCTIHAEVNAIRNCKDKKKLRGSSLYVVRLNKNNENSVLNSAPCANCQKFLKKIINKYGLLRIYYSTNIILN